MIRSALEALDKTLGTLAPGILKDRPALISLLFHKVFADKGELGRNLVTPEESATPDDFRRLFDTFLSAGYGFVTPDQVIDGALDPEQNHILLSFDDGYANNLRLLPVLKEYTVPATIFVATGFTGADHAFWWDAVYRARMKNHTWDSYPAPERHAMHGQMKADAEDHVRAAYGGEFFDLHGELDRPLNEAELWELSAEPLITLGNHTVDHTLLTSLTPEQANAQIADAQNFLARVTGTRPRTLAYPYGNWSPEIAAAAKANGIELALTCDAHRNRLPLEPSDLLTLGRFSVLMDERFAARCHDCRLDFSLTRLSRRVAAQIK